MSKFDKYGDKFDALRGKLKQKRAEEESRKSGGFDDSWKFKPSLPQNKSKVTYKLRILPNIHSETGEPWILGLYHMFRRPDGKFIYTLCPTTYGKDKECPICEKAKAYYSTGDQRDEDRGQKLYKKKRYFSNVLVVSDPRAGEENQEGQVLVWEYGKSIYEKLEDTLLDSGINFFHPTEGREFNLVVKKKGEYNNYDSSSFAANETPISEDEDEMDKIFEQIYDLEKQVFRDGAKDYDKLQELLTGNSQSSSNNVDRVVDSEPENTSDDDDSFDDDDDDDEVEEKPAAKAAVANSSDDDDDDDFNFDFDDED